MISIKSFENLKQIKNRDLYTKICESAYVNTVFDVTNQNEEIEKLLPTEIINMGLENKFTDIRCMTKSGVIYIIEGQTGPLTEADLERYYEYFKETGCDWNCEIRIIILCLSEKKNLKSLRIGNIHFKPLVFETKKYDGEKHLNKLRMKFKNNIELDHEDCGFLVHLILFKLPITEQEYIREICHYIKHTDCIPEEKKRKIIPAMYLNIHYFIKDEKEQEKLIGDVNLIKYCENALDERIRMEIERNTEDVTKKVTDDVTKKVTDDVTKKVTDDVTEKHVLACLNGGISEEKIHNMFGVPLNRIMELKSTL